MKYAGLYPKEQVALDIILENPTITMDELGNKLGVKQTVANVYVSNLKKRGYIRTQTIFIPIEKEVAFSFS